MTSHDYLSTGCLHGEHGYCQAHTGLSGNKVPATCKFCGAPCRCECHTPTPIPDTPPDGQSCGHVPPTPGALVNTECVVCWPQPWVNTTQTPIEAFDLVPPRSLQPPLADWEPLAYPLAPSRQRAYPIYPIADPVGPGCATHSWGTVHVKPGCRCPKRRR